MKSIWITALALIVGVLGSPLAAAGPHLQIENRQFRNESFVLPDLLHAIKSQTGAIDDILNKHPGPILGDEAKKVASEVGVHLHNITESLRSAGSILSSLDKDTKLVDEDGNLCNVTCIVDKAKGLVKLTGKTGRKSLLKLGLHALGKTISPFFLALSGIVLAINAIVGGALAALAALVNGIGLAIAAGLAYLGRLVSEKDKEMIGGPGGNITSFIGNLIGHAVGEKLAKLDL
ncbi:hypothetical protein SLS64_001547 [Diaporthe eres]|uniref:Uncharacterized protein n=1 Tax=Diaporthe eres TaxID=83184 RepID=A0ABR1PDZ0_DIAER